MNNEPLDSSQPDETTPLEQLAQRFETYADDQDACIRHKWVKGAKVIEALTKAATWRDAAKDLRQLELDIASKGLGLAIINKATGLPVVS